MVKEKRKRSTERELRNKEHALKHMARNKYINEHTVLLYFNMLKCLVKITKNVVRAVNPGFRLHFLVNS